MEEIKIQTNTREEFIDITREIEEKIEGHTGIVFLQVPHTTAAITINENADPTVETDMIRKLKELIPKNDDYEHLEGNSDSHLKTSLFGSTQIIYAENGKINLGTWQGIFFCEFDGPRSRKLHIKKLN